MRGHATYYVDPCIDCEREESAARYYSNLPANRVQSRLQSRKHRRSDPDYQQKHNAYCREHYDEEQREKDKKRKRVRRGVMTPDGLEFSAILEHDPCCYCGSVMKIVIDHIDPVILGGDGTSDNLTAACGVCNLKKQHRPWWRLMLINLGRA